MNGWGTLLSAVGQTIELVGVLWLIVAAVRETRRPSTWEDVLHIRERISSGGFGKAAITVAVGLAVAVVGGWMQVWA